MRVQSDIGGHQARAQPATSSNSSRTRKISPHIRLDFLLLSLALIPNIYLLVGRANEASGLTMVGRQGRLAYQSAKVVDEIYIADGVLFVQMIVDCSWPASLLAS